MIHQFELNGYHIVLDVCSGAVHVVDELAYEMIARFEEMSLEEITAAMLEKYREEEVVTEAEIRRCYAEIEALKADGQLFTPDNFAPMAGEFKARSGDVIKALCLHVAHTCNLNCSYCFASQGKYHGERAVMSPEVGKRALDFLIEHSGTRRNLEVDFFGGEPLMNFDTVKELVAYARVREKEAGKNFRFTLTTNGMLIDDDVIDFCNREMSNVVLSLDGRKEVTDILGHRRTIGSVKRIPTAGMKGSADIHILKGGTAIYCEVKIGKDRQSEAQKAFQASVEESGGHYIIARDFDDFLNNINSL